MIDYVSIFLGQDLKTISDLMKFFEEHITTMWIDLYIEQTGCCGDITLQYYHQYAYLFDDTSTGLSEGLAGLPEPRVLGAFGISRTDVWAKNRKIMRMHPKAASAALKLNNDFKYDNGHFMSHLSGGSIDLNLFPQRRDVNRGWKLWNKYREMERFVAANPGTFAFSRPIYDDLTIIPCQL